MVRDIEIPAPGFDQWKFIDDLKKEPVYMPLWSRSHRNVDEISMLNGVVLKKEFPDEKRLLDSACSDLEKFLTQSGIPVVEENTKEQTVIVMKKLLYETEYEYYEIDVNDLEISISSNDTEGIRRGIYHLENMMLSSDGPFLEKGSLSRSPWVKHRISRCFFGPIKRPPFNRDELADDVDYYPDEYLNRLAHEGINVLWITIEFRDLCKTKFVKEYGRDREKRLDKLRRTAQKTALYGIKLFLFTIEPRIWDDLDPLYVENPMVAGAAAGNYKCFCPFSQISEEYIYESVKSIFTEVPELGGMINISHGERPTTCLSSLSAISRGEINCPRCSGHKKGEILKAVLEPAGKAMKEINPDACLISWLYMPQVSIEGEWIYDLPQYYPSDVSLVFNFESGAGKYQAGKMHYGADYWQSFTGPSPRFKKMADKTAESKGMLGAKIQVGCSHEIATIPFIPVPSLLWEKYRQMKELNVQDVIQSWYFGNYPGLMNEAAGELSFCDFTHSMEEFLLKLAKSKWGRYSCNVVEAWKLFGEAYENYPFETAFQYYGPIHDGLVWPLCLFPEHKPLARNWKPDFPLSKDSIGECLNTFTLEEVVDLTGRMSGLWDRGVDILEKLKCCFINNDERLKDIYLARAISLQFRSAFNILKFYLFRDELLESRSIKILDRLRNIVLDEIENSYSMIVLCSLDNRLGFHSEAETYKYFPEKLSARITVLNELLDEDFPEMENHILNNIPFDESLPVYVIGRDNMVKTKTFSFNCLRDGNLIKINVFTDEIDGKEWDGFFLYIKASDNGYPLQFSIYEDIEQKKYTDPYMREGLDLFYLKKGNHISFKIDPEKIPGYRGRKILFLALAREYVHNGIKMIDHWGKGNPKGMSRLCLGDYDPQNMGRLIF